MFITRQYHMQCLCYIITTAHICKTQIFVQLYIRHFRERNLLGQDIHLQSTLINIFYQCIQILLHHSYHPFSLRYLPKAPVKQISLNWAALILLLVYAVTSSESNIKITAMTTIPGFLTKTYEIFNTPEYTDCCGWGNNGSTIVIKKVCSQKSAVMDHQ